MRRMAEVAAAPRGAPEVRWPFFRAWRGTAQGAGRPLGIISGGLILDSGEAERTFIFRCQDRYLAYSALHGLRSVLFVAGDEHVRCYREELEGFRRSWDAIAAATGALPPELPEPLFVTCDIDRLKLGTCWALLEQLRRGVVARGPLPDLYLNQISPTTAELVAQLGELLRAHGASGDFAPEECARAGALALRFHDKAGYVRLLSERGGPGLPPHVPTAVVAPEQFLALRSWEALVSLYRERSGDTGAGPAALYVKSSLDSGGNVSARLTPDGFQERSAWLRREVEQHVLCRGVDLGERVRELREEVNAAPALRPLGLTDDRLGRYKRLQLERRTGIELLVQREVAPPADLGGRFAGLGLSWQVEGPDDIAPIAVAAQLYRDPDRLHYLGSYLSPALEGQVLASPLAAQVRRLCRLFADQGWRGPINFDARLNAEGEYELIYDCNPRLSAVFPSLAVRQGLRALGLRAEGVLGLGYRGGFVWEDLPGKLAELEARGLLYTRDRQRGAVVLPNLSRRSGFDVALVNVDVASARQWLASGAFDQGGGASAPGLHV
ncbi:MAG TPA: hypothetical protein VND93_00915 [Myxococcales bacterium]|nr:hypothetical protein [Myxococcales bacterium]